MVESGTVGVQAASFATYGVTAGGAANDTRIAIHEEEITGGLPPTEVAFAAGAEDGPCIIQGDGFNIEISG